MRDAADAYSLDVPILLYSQSYFPKKWRMTPEVRPAAPALWRTSDNAPYVAWDPAKIIFRLF
jgi:hypothetical protein